MNRVTKKSRACWISLGSLLLVVGLAGAAVLFPWWGKTSEYDGRIETLQLQLHRFESLMGRRERLEGELRGLQEQYARSRYFIEAATPDLAAAMLQNRVKEVVTSGGGSLVSTQNLGETSADRPVRIAVRVRMTGNDEVLAKVLHELEDGRPLLFIENLSIRSQARVRGRGPNRVTDYMLDVNFDLVGYLREAAG